MDGLDDMAGLTCRQRNGAAAYRPASATLAQTASPPPGTTALKRASTRLRRPKRLPRSRRRPSRREARRAPRETEAAGQETRRARRRNRPSRRRSPPSRRSIGPEPKEDRRMPRRSAPPSYTVTTTRDNVTYTTTRIVPLPPRDVVRRATIAAVPVSLAPAHRCRVTHSRGAGAGRQRGAARRHDTGRRLCRELPQRGLPHRAVGRHHSLQRRAQLADLFARKMDVRGLPATPPPTS